MVDVTRGQLAELRGCHVKTVSRYDLPRLPNGRYDLMNPQVLEFFLEPIRSNWERERRPPWKIPKPIAIRPAGDVVPRPVGDIDESDTLDDELKKEQIALKARQSRKLDLDHEVRKKMLVPMELIKTWVGLFSSGIRNNFLSIGNRVARGDTELRDRIEAEITRSIQRTIDLAESSLAKEFKE